MNYYINGDAAKADKIKAAFKAKGISDGGNSFIHENYLYFSEGGEVDFCGIGGHIANIIKTHPDYKELELSVKPNFKVGDWIVSSSGTFVGIIRKIRHYGYFIELMHGDEIAFTKNRIEQDFHLWTIADAKDGDVLISENGNPFIFCEDGGCDDDYDIFAYGGLNEMGEFYESYHKTSWTYRTSLKPATKEQRDLLFAKMKEAGYEWDENKKELRKINPHYGITNFHEGMPVLVRNGNWLEWEYVTFSHYRNVGTPFCAGGQYWYQCIPYNYDTKHLLGTTDMPSEEFINW